MSRAVLRSCCSAQDGSFSQKQHMAFFYHSGNTKPTRLRKSLVTACTKSAGQPGQWSGTSAWSLAASSSPLLLSCSKTLTQRAPALARFCLCASLKSRYIAYPQDVRLTVRESRETPGTSDLGLKPPASPPLLARSPGLFAMSSLLAPERNLLCWCCPNAWTLSLELSTPVTPGLVPAAGMRPTAGLCWSGATRRCQDGVRGSALHLAAPLTAVICSLTGLFLARKNLRLLRMFKHMSLLNYSVCSACFWS